MRRLRITRDADTDVLEIWTYHFAHSQKAAERIVRQITSEYDTLLAFPNLGRKREEIGADYRSLPVDDYIIYYCVLEDSVNIMRVLHSARDITSILPSEPAEEN